MRGLPGIIIAVALGIVGAICNWAYLAQQSSRMEKVSFLALESTAQLNVGDRFQKSHFKRVDIPRDNLGNLDQVAVSFNQLSAVVGMAATKAYRGNEILLQQDLRTPGHRDLSHLLAVDEVARWVPVDSRSFVPERVNPGNLISFIVTGPGASGGSGTSSQPIATSSSTRIIGPFRILSLGARTGDRDVRRANTDARGGQEHLIGIGVKIEDGKLEPKADQLFEALATRSNAPLQVLLHSAEMKDKPLP
jgi:Flp pilus assembly protein CpaB